MSRATEKIFKEFGEYMKLHGEPESEDQLREVI